MSVSAHGFEFKQSKGALQGEAKKLVTLLSNSNAKIICTDAKGKDAVVIQRGQNLEDKTGLLLSGSFSYGTNEISHISVNEDLLITYGEEGNYTLVIKNFIGLLFGLQDDDSYFEFGSAKGVVINEDNQATVLNCRAQLPKLGEK
jgi:hypothetical protein